MKLRLELEEQRNKCCMINIYDVDTGEWLSRKVINNHGKIICKSFNYYKAHKALIKAAKGVRR